MRAIETFSLTFGEKVYAIEVFNDDSSDILAIALKNSILIYQFNVAEDSSVNTESEGKLQNTLVQAVSILLIPTE